MSFLSSHLPTGRQARNPINPRNSTDFTLVVRNCLVHHAVQGFAKNEGEVKDMGEVWKDAMVDSLNKFSQGRLSAFLPKSIWR